MEQDNGVESDTERKREMQVGTVALQGGHKDRGSNAPQSTHPTLSYENELLRLGCNATEIASQQGPPEKPCASGLLAGLSDPYLFTCKLAWDSWGSPRVFQSQWVPGSHQRVALSPVSSGCGLRIAGQPASLGKFISVESLVQSSGESGLDFPPTPPTPRSETRQTCARMKEELMHGVGEVATRLGSDLSLSTGEKRPPRGRREGRGSGHQGLQEARLGFQVRPPLYDLKPSPEPLRARRLLVYETRTAWMVSLSAVTWAVGLRVLLQAVLDATLPFTVGLLPLTLAFED
ncbi:hypothetical protein GW7_10170 [Heterocephalus glaber]|uniref:Uncharacterized protein n=1 Tax=Heterocephalus glaber TaxID=10181 RepID=G5AKS4_HETGA|nr:hypothetical protein GW7_10170 [Heterocephalus glaber]